jgi:hypothetical protein
VSTAGAAEEIATPGDSSSGRFAEVRCLIEDARHAGLPLLVVEDNLRCGGNIDAVAGGLKSRLSALRRDVIAELTRPGFISGQRSKDPVRLPDYWFGWWSEMKVDRLLPNITHVAWRLRGSLCADRFRHAVACITARHALLSARITDQNSLLQIEFREERTLIREPAAGRASGRDSSAAPQARTMAEEIVWTPLRDGQVFRPFLVEISSTEVICGFVLHHLVADFYACHLVARELCSHLRAGSQRSDVEGQWLAYSDYVRAMSRWENGAAGEYRLAYWMSHLQAVPEVRLPTEANVPPDSVTRFGTVEFVLDEELRSRLIEVADGSATTLAQVLLAAKFVTLAAYLQQPDLLITVIVSGRDDPALLRFIGNTADCLPIRLTVRQNQSFAGLLEQLRSTYALGCRYRIKWELVLKAFAAEATECIAPTFNFVSAGRAMPARRNDNDRRPGLCMDAIRLARPPEHGSAAWHKSHDMNLFDDGRRITGHIKYMPAKQSTTTVESFVQAFLKCLERIAGSGARRIPDLL